jgi:tRNA-specific 2-thiouridylase
MKKVNKKTRVVVAMSGGVDSSVAAALLKKQGYDVVGVFMRFWAEPAKEVDPLQLSFKKEGGGGRNTCCSEGAEQAARAVAAKLGIPFYVLRFEKEFKKAVVDYFLAEEKRGRTPNPCAVCNKKIKFGLLLGKALGLGADYMATGHYARLRREFPNKYKILKSKIIYKLIKAKDENKDQSYFLYTLAQKQLSRVLFPLGDYMKDEVCRLARKWRLPYRQGESFDLCFVAKDKDSFLKKYLKLKPGKIVQIYHSCEKGDPEIKSGCRMPSSPMSWRAGKPGMTTNESGKILGEHQGLALYTIGQRKNIPVGRGPWWVVKKDERKNILYVSNEDKYLYGSELAAKNINWLNGQAPNLPLKVLVKIRYKSEASQAVVCGIVVSARQDSRNEKVIVKFKNSQRAITSGQSVVFYGTDGEVLGGGTIG